MINRNMTNREIFESGILRGRSFRAIKDKRTEIVTSEAMSNSSTFMPIDYITRNRFDIIANLKDTFNVDKELEPMIRKKENGHTYQEIANSLGYSFSYVKNKLEQWSTFKRVFDAVFGRYPKVDEVFFEEAVEDEEFIEDCKFEELWDIFNDWIGRKRSEICPPDDLFNDSGCEKYLIIQDTHIPFHDEDYLVNIIEKHKDEIDALVISGDFLDCYSISPFPKYNDVTIREELTEAVKVLQYLSENVRRIILVTGNHENRVKKAVYKKLDKDMIFLMRTDLLDFVAKGLALDMVGREFSNVEVINNWYYQIGDAIMGHPEIYSTVQLKSAIKSYEWFKKWRGRLGLDDFRFLSHAHTHRAGIAYVEEDSELHMVVETGACCLIQDYAIRGESKGRYSPPQNGYVLLVQKEGRTVFNETRLFVQDVYNDE